MASAFDYTLVIGGQAGQGMQTLGMLLTQALLRSGVYLSTYQSYQSRIRGGHNYFQIRIASRPIHSVTSQMDILVALDEFTLQCHCSELSKQSVILYDLAHAGPGQVCTAGLGLDVAKVFPLAAKEEIYSTSVFAGAVTQLLALDAKKVVEIMHTSLGKKSEQVLADNLAAFQAGQEFIRNQAQWDSRFRIEPISGRTDDLVMHANQALALGAMAADCRFYSAYPMTPSTTIFETMAAAAEKKGIVVEQAEDEIAALNMALGASFAGVRAMTGTSGGGFALMTEAVSLAGITECPVVIVDAQRPGPATGLPTRSEQGDLEFVIHAGHGEFPKVVLAPGDHAQCFHLAARAFNWADQYQIPVILLTDQYLADLFQNVSARDLRAPEINRGKLIESQASYQRYQITPDGVSPWAIPGKGEGLVVVDSDEHTEDGHLTEDLQVRQAMHEKRLRKYQLLREEMILPEVLGTATQNAVLCWGSTKGVCQDATEILQSRGHQVAMVHFQQLWPMNPDKIKALLSRFGRLICVENNATGQLARLLRAETSMEVSERILKSNGLPFFLDELVANLEKLLA